MLMPYKCPEKARQAQRRYFKKHYEANKERFAHKALRRRERIREYIASKKTGPCKDCGGRFHWVAMDFDHVRGDKLFEIGEATRVGISEGKIDAEIEKCDLVCSNCHRIRTYNRWQYRGETGSDGPFEGPDVGSNPTTPAKLLG